MANANAGTATLSVDGKNFLLQGSFRWSPSTYSRESLVGMDGPHGYKQTPVMPFMSATLRDSDGLSVTDLNAMTNVTVTAQLANGKTVVGRGMWTVGVQEVESADGTLDVRWEGPQVLEL